MRHHRRCDVPRYRGYSPCCRHDRIDYQYLDTCCKRRLACIVYKTRGRRGLKRRNNQNRAGRHTNTTGSDGRPPRPFILKFMAWKNISSTQGFRSNVTAYASSFMVPEVWCCLCIDNVTRRSYRVSLSGDMLTWTPLTTHDWKRRRRKPTLRKKRWIP